MVEIADFVPHTPVPAEIIDEYRGRVPDELVDEYRGRVPDELVEISE